VAYSLSLTFFDVLHNPHFAGIVPFGIGNDIELDFASQGNVLFNLLFASHKLIYLI